MNNMNEENPANCGACVFRRKIRRRRRGRSKQTIKIERYLIKKNTMQYTRRRSTKINIIIIIVMMMMVMMIIMTMIMIIIKMMIIMMMMMVMMMMMMIIQYLLPTSQSVSTVLGWRRFGTVPFTSRS